MTGSLDGLITFFSWHHAIRAEKVLGRDGYEIELIPGPREISANCGTALRFEYCRDAEARAVLERERVQIEATHEYVPLFVSIRNGEPAEGRTGVVPGWVRRWL
jgi:hypothetical protein